MVIKSITIAIQCLLFAGLFVVKGCALGGDESVDSIEANMASSNGGQSSVSSSPPADEVEEQEQNLESDFDQEIALMLSEHLSRKNEWDANKPESYEVFYVDTNHSPISGDSERAYKLTVEANNTVSALDLLSGEDFGDFQYLGDQSVIDIYFNKIELWLTESPSIFFRELEHEKIVSIAYDYQDHYPYKIYQNYRNRTDSEFTLYFDIKDGADELEEILALKQLWLSNAIDHYTMSVTDFSGNDIFLEIKDAEILASFFNETGEDKNSFRLLGDRAPLMESWYDMIIEKIDEEAIALDVVADDKGVLESIFLVYLAGSGDLLSFKIQFKNFTVLE